MAFAELPVELLHWVCSYLEPPEVQIFRLVCRVFNAVGEEYLLEEVKLYFNLPSTQKITEIGQSSRLSKYPRSLVFQTDSLPLEYNYSQWNEQRRDPHLPDGYWLDHMPDVEEQHRLNRGTERDQRMANRISRSIPQTIDSIRRPALPRKELEEAYEHYRRLVREEGTILAEGILLRSLVTIFEACRNLDHVVINRGECMREGVPRNVAAYFPSLVGPSFHEEGIGVAINSTQALQVFKAADEVSRKIRKLELGPISFQLFVSISDPNPGVHSQPEKMEGCVEYVLQHLESLRMTMMSFMDDPHGAEYEINNLHDNNLRNCLSACQNLTELDLTLVHLHDEYPAIKLRFAIGQIIWPHLRKLKISHLLTGQDEFVDLLLRHRNTLESLGLREIFLTDGTWVECLNAFIGKLENIKHVQLRGRFGIEVADGEARRIFTFVRTVIPEDDWMRWQDIDQMDDEEYDAFEEARLFTAVIEDCITNGETLPQLRPQRIFDTWGMDPW